MFTNISKISEFHTNCYFQATCVDWLKYGLSVTSSAMRPSPISEISRHQMVTWILLLMSNMKSGHFSPADTAQQQMTSVISRIRNNLVKALNEHNTLPKAIIVVLDDDITKTLSLDKEFSITVGRILSWLVKEFHKCIAIYKDWLPAKAKLPNYPHIIWMAPLNHYLFTHNDNTKRDKFSRCL